FYVSSFSFYLHSFPSRRSSDLLVVILFSIFYICSICFVHRAYCTKHEAVFWRIRRKSFAFVVDFVFDSATVCRFTETHRCFSLFFRDFARLSPDRPPSIIRIFCGAGVSPPSESAAAHPGEGGNTMARVYNFSAGPSMLPESVLKTAQAELLDYHGSGMSVMEMSHRSKWFDEIIQNTEASMRRVLNIPDNYKIGFFQGGATQQFAMVPLNFMTTGTADYLVTGNFSKKAAEEAAKFGTARIAASSKDKNFTYIPDVKAIDYDPNASYIHICQNNTIFGTKFVDVPQVEGIPLVADMSSMICSEPVDVSKYGVIYFGVQKNIAPAGMAVAIVREDLLGKSAKGLTPEQIPTMMNYTTLLKADSMYNTPPCWCIYMTGLV